MDEPINSPEPYLLVLTASIVPNQIAGVTRADPAQRRRDYAGALEKYWQLSAPEIGGVLFIENSGADLTDLQRITAIPAPASRQIEFVSLNENDFDPTHGKGYGEYRMLDRGLANSALAQRFSYWVKVTGRYFIANLPAILRGLKQPFGLACDLKDHCCLGRRYQSFDTGLTIYHRDFYRRRVLGIYNQVYERDFSPDWLENVLYRLAVSAPTMGEVVIPRFARTPRVLGHAGHHGKNYNSPLARGKWLVKSVARRLFPALWI